MDHRDIKFSRDEMSRYNRHIIIPEFGLEAQQKLKASKVLVIGSGGLGSPVLLYLAAAGIGTIGIVDFDVVDDSNLQRQVLFGVGEVGQPKVEAAKRRLESLNPHINLKVYNTQLTSKNALDLIKDYDVVADGTDNFPTRYLVNDACVLLGKTNVYASIFQFEGQVSVFNYINSKGELGPNYRDLYATPPPAGLGDDGRRSGRRDHGRKRRGRRAQPSDHVRLRHGAGPGQRCSQLDLQQVERRLRGGQSAVHVSAIYVSSSGRAPVTATARPRPPWPRRRSRA